MVFKETVEFLINNEADKKVKEFQEGESQLSKRLNFMNC